MGNKLSKIANDLNVKIAVILKFFNANGINYKEDPDEVIADEDEVFLQNNLLPFVSEDNKDNVRTPVKVEKTPLELRMIERASLHTKLIERVIGYTQFWWSYTVAKYNGVCSQPIKFTLFDEVICGLLLRGKMSAERIGNILGFDINNNAAERNILRKGIKSLVDDKMVEDDNGEYWLTNVGADYAKNGVKFSTFNRDFELYIDETADLQAEVKEVLKKLVSERVGESRARRLPQDPEEVRNLAEIQAPEIHCPDKNFRLQSYTPIGVESYRAKVWAILLENFRDNTSRVLVYDETSDDIIEPMSEALSRKEDTKKFILNKLIAESNDGDFSVKLTTEEKPEIQVIQEQKLIEMQDRIEAATEGNDERAVAEVKKEVSVVKKYFNSLEFEVELKHLFDDTKGDLWIISPWIRRRAMSNRIPFFEQYIAKGGRIFVAYSEPEQHENGMVQMTEEKPMADEEPLAALKDMEKKYQNFYLHQLSPFHYKHVFLLNEGKGQLYYDGSYNILSFFVQQGSQKIRQESMTKVEWDSGTDSVFGDIADCFGDKYLSLVARDFRQLCGSVSSTKIDRVFIQRIQSQTFSKLKPFVGHNLKSFDVKYKQLLEERASKTKMFIDKFVGQELSDMRLELEKITGPVSTDKKRSFQNSFSALMRDFPDADYEGKGTDTVSQLIDNLQTYNKVIKGRKRR